METSINLYRYEELLPLLGANVYLAPGARVIGSVRLGDDVSIWYNAVLRGDSDTILVGRGSNIQDLSMVHSDPGIVVEIGEDVTVGHNCCLHGCRIGNGSLIGIGSIVLNHSVIGEHSLVAAGSLITEHKSFPPYTLIMGRPAKVVRELNDEELEHLQRSPRTYVARAAAHLKAQSL
jgi:carbonic anhydrase/acetyltransferase-like protein (isoleucine patch superfamily)